MKRVLQVLLCLALSAVVMAGLLAAALLYGLPTDGIHLTIDGESWMLPPMHAGHWLAVTACLLVVALAIGIAVAVALLAAGLMLSPVLLLAGLLWLVWRLLERRPKAPQAPQASAEATIRG